eukprot:TRINITY_DN38345_c0_g1_i1.p1 TRINITY_DN38345_c0_g1~~TRINITY_DN38345_c0_g1_i1.p1  ORF type:complete len:501 (+),score=95.52 TRINITY_DN38345_c0_g1_i1:36-1505(+)
MSAYVALDGGSDYVQDEDPVTVAEGSGKNSENIGILRQLTQALALSTGAAAVIFGWVAVYQELDHRHRKQVILASIPLVALLFTWFHIWLAIQMMFRPLKFFGIYQYRGTGIGLGWQGVVPRKAAKMAATAYRCARPFLMSPAEMFEKVDPATAVTMTKPHLDQIIDDVFRKIGKRHLPELIDKLPPTVLEEIKDACFEKIKETSPLLWNALGEVVCDRQNGLDNERMPVKVFTENKALLNKFFMSLGNKEFRFIERTGAAFGFVCGIVQLLAYQELDETGRAIFLPLTGFFLGIITNWLAILMCFKPCWPRKLRICGWHFYTLQGLFLKRQDDVSVIYSKLMTQHIFHFTKAVEYMQTQPKLWARLKDVYCKHNVFVLREVLGVIPVKLAPVAIGHDSFRALEEDVQTEMAKGLAASYEMHNIITRYFMDKTGIYRNNVAAMRNMPPDQFENLLHPVFQEDEWILILLGGVLGAIVGAAQVRFLPADM